MHFLLKRNLSLPTHFEGQDRISDLTMYEFWSLTDLDSNLEGAPTVGKFMTFDPQLPISETILPVAVIAWGTENDACEAPTWCPASVE